MQFTISTFNHHNDKQEPHRCSNGEKVAYSARHQHCRIGIPFLDRILIGCVSTQRQKHDSYVGSANRDFTSLFLKKSMHKVGSNLLRVVL